MMRPPRAGEGRHVAQHRKYLLAIAVFLLPWLPLVDAQQQQQPQQIREPRVAPQAAGGSRAARDHGALRVESPLQAGGDRVVPSFAPTALTREVVETPNIRRKNTLSTPQDDRHGQLLIPDDASAIATLAPDQSVRAPSLRRRPGGAPSSVGAGVSTPQIARSLGDWEVEDFVLLATVDGDLYASDRKTGKVRWHLEVEQPMVETVHHRSNTSVLEDDYSPIDHYIWAVEPSRDGSLYLWIPDSGAGLVRTGFTMKKMVEELAPYVGQEPPVVYTGTKGTTVMTLDAATGRVLRWFGPGGSQVNDENSCLRPNALADLDSEECSNSGTITLTRTEYTVDIQRKDLRRIVTLKYSEWGPNNFDNDLIQQYHSTMDNQYITSQHDGRVYGFDLSRETGAPPLFGENFPSPVARVFDVARPWEAREGSSPELVILPQPAPPAEDDNVAQLRSASIFLNQTEAGSWYALSGRSYPLILDAPTAQVSRWNWWDQDRPWDVLSDKQVRKALVGTHSLGNAFRDATRQHPPTLPGGALVSPVSPDDPENESVPSLPAQSPEPSSIIQKVKTIPQIAADSVVDFIRNPVMIILFVTFFFYYRKEFGRWAKGKSRDMLAPAVKATPGEVAPEPGTVRARDVSAEDVAKTGSEDTAAPDQTQPAVPETGEPAEGSLLSAAEASTGDASELPAEKEKKKTHRGRRGGVRHRKGKKREGSVSRDDEPPIQSVQEAVDIAKKLGEQPRLEPDILTVKNDVQEVSDPVLRMGSLEVDENQQLGTGSNGTVVFAGKWDGRSVAVKRMLIQFYDIASQETKLLRESDDHPNVIRYYAQQQRNAFLYIALELCQASLADIIEKPQMFRELAQAGERDLPGVLYQITNGLSYLHSLRIVHRDLKPQNILVNMGKNGRPRLLVSDFGLCKKLEGGQSSFGATTAHAAGTSGWRAPELLLDDDARDSGMVEASSTHSGSGSNLVSPELMPNRRATRAIDIFSLGLVFYYVLTKGSHPFDCGDRYMREVNIRKDNYSLRLLDVLGDYAYEAKDLIGAMLQSDPRRRPPAKDVMAHPFFWPAKKRLNFLVDVSDHFEKEPREPPSAALQELERHAAETIRGDFLKQLPKDFVESLGKQRKYTGTRMLDLLRALRNKKNHYEDMPDALKRQVGPLPEGYLGFWTRRFPSLLITCWNVVYEVQWDETDRFREYYEPANL